jgi:predicted KAP-like P-loop ATPase
MQKDIQNKHIFQSDRPIFSKAEDRLNRASFAESLANAVIGWKGNDSLVIALYGEWGSGKSSVKNLMLETLEFKGIAKPYVVEFNPWQWAEQDRLLQAFFDEIGVQLGKVNKNTESLLSKWKMYQSYLKASTFIFDSLKRVSFFVLSAIAGINIIGLLFMKYWWVKLLLFIVGTLAGILAIICNWGGVLFEKLVGALSARNEVKKKTLQQIKKELTDDLLKLDKPILVIIDDVDRLSPNELKLLVQLIKANADFPNLVYLMLFQRDIVEKNLSRALKVDGKDFLEKIVQVGFNIPYIAKSDLENTLLKSLNEVLNNTPIWGLFDQQRWGNIYHGGFKSFFENLRDVKRYLSALSFHISVFRGQNVFEVNPIDLIALEVLRTFEPKVYNQLPEVKSALTQKPSDLYGQDFQTQNREILVNLINSSSKPKQTYVKEILELLFPLADWPNRIGYYFDDLGRYYREIRVCHPKIFDRYFQLVIPSGDISHNELNGIISIIGNRELLFEELLGYLKYGKIETLFNRLDNYKEEFDLHHIVPFLTVLFDIGDHLPKEYGNMDGLSSILHIWRIIHFYLKREEKKNRKEIFSQALSLTNGVFIPTNVLSLEIQELTKNPDNDNLFDSEAIDFLKKQCLEKIRDAASSNQLLYIPNLSFILYDWKEWSANEEVSEWINSIIETKEGMLAFLKCFLHRTTSQGMDDYVVKVYWRMSLGEIEKFIQIETIITKISQLDLVDLTEEDARVKNAFDNALKRKAKGLPDDRINFQDDDF